MHNKAQGIRPYLVCKKESHFIFNLLKFSTKIGKPSSRILGFLEIKDANQNTRWNYV